MRKIFMSVVCEVKDRLSPHSSKRSHVNVDIPEH